MKNEIGIGRRELFRKLAGSAGAVAMAAALPGSTALAEDDSGDQRSPLQSSTDSATVRVILSDGTTVQWLAVTSGGMTVGGRTSISPGSTTLNKSVILAAIQAIVAAGGPQLTPQQVTLLGGKTS